MKGFELGDMECLVESDGCSVYQFRNETGEGTITMYEVFPGVYLAYNDFHMQYYDSTFQPDRNMLCIDHCREGRMEYLSGSHTYSYVGVGDLKIDRRLSHERRFDFPLSHYHGAMINIDMDIASRSIPEEIKDFPVDLSALQEKYCEGIYPMVIHNACSIEHIFGELYAVPERIKRPYYKLKILELLLYLDALELPADSEEKPYFYKSQVEKTKAVCEFIQNHMDENYTQEELAARFDITQTQMKRCFKSVFGTTIGNWLLQYRMNQAAVILKTERSVGVAEIAGRVGYDSPSKFAIAFRRVMGCSPTEYRGLMRRN